MERGRPARFMRARRAAPGVSTHVRGNFRGSLLMVHGSDGDDTGGSVDGFCQEMSDFLPPKNRKLQLSTTCVARPGDREYGSFTFEVVPLSVNAQGVNGPMCMDHTRMKARKCP